MKRFFLIASIFVVAILFLGGLRLLRQRRDTQKPPLPTAGAYSAGNYNESLVIDGRARTYLLHIPTGYDSQKPYPLVIALHGGGGSGERIMEQTKLNTISDREGFIVAYPDAVSGGRRAERQWNDGRGTMASAENGIDDIAFIRTLVNTVAHAYLIDAKRVFAAGISNGGIMTYRLGCEASDIFAAIAPVAANLAEPLAACSPQHPISVMQVNGTKDPFISVDGGECCKVVPWAPGGRLLSIRDSLSRFLRKNACQETPMSETLPASINDGTAIEKQVFPGCGSGADVVLYLVHGGGHAWPPNEPEAPRLAGISSKNLDTSEAVWEFFKTHSR